MLQCYKNQAGKPDTSNWKFGESLYTLRKYMKVFSSYLHIPWPAERPHKEWQTVWVGPRGCWRSGRDRERWHLESRSKKRQTAPKIVGFYRVSWFLKNVRRIPSMRAAVGISLALICDAQSPWQRAEEHFLLNSSKLSKIFLWSSSCKTLKWHLKKSIKKRIWRLYVKVE